MCACVCVSGLFHLLNRFAAAAEVQRRKFSESCSKRDISGVGVAPEEAARSRGLFVLVRNKLKMQPFSNDNFHNKHLL